MASQSSLHAEAGSTPEPLWQNRATRATSQAPGRAIRPSRGWARCRLVRCCQSPYERSRTAGQAPERIGRVPVGSLAAVHRLRWPRCCRAVPRRPCRKPELRLTTPRPEPAFPPCRCAGFAVRSLGNEPRTDPRAQRLVRLARGLSLDCVELAATVERKPCAVGFSVREPRHTVSR